MNEVSAQPETLVLQTIFLTMSDGRKGAFTGTLLVAPFEASFLTVQDVGFSEPIEMPITPEMAGIAGMLDPSLLASFDDTGNDKPH